MWKLTVHLPQFNVRSTCITVNIIPQNVDSIKKTVKTALEKKDPWLTLGESILPYDLYKEALFIFEGPTNDT